MYLQAIVALSLSLVQPFLCYEGVESSGNPIFEYLGMEPDSISEHELVEIDFSERSHKRGLGEATPMSFRAFGINLRLWLHPTDDTFIPDGIEVYRSEFKPEEKYWVQYVAYPDALKNIGRILQDPNHLASVILDSDDSGKTTVTAYLKSPVDNAPLTIRPLPAHVIREYMRKKRSIDDLSDDFIDSTYHVVLKLNNDKYKNHTMDVLDGVRAKESWNTDHDEAADHENIEYQRGVPTLYAEILVQTDETLGFDVTNTAGLNRALKYLLVFWNSVNLVYRQVEYPRIKLSIGGIIFGTHRHTVPFIAANPLMGLHGEDGFDSRKAIEQSVEFFKRWQEAFPFYRYDLIATMTTRPMGTSKKLGVLGIAYLWGVCGKNFTTIINDNIAFNGVGVAAHELGHLFTLEHDEGRVGTVCHKANGFIMAPSLSSTENRFTFSPCSLNSLARNFTSSRFRCLRNKPTGRVPTVSVPLPGKVSSLAEQCAGEVYDSEPCHLWGKDDICATKYCTVLYSDGTTYCHRVSPALHGTPCIRKEDGRPGVCLNFRCISQRKSIIGVEMLKVKGGEQDRPWEK